ncbi:TnsA endonuclease N-terminal domain-containing protein [Salipaludibacillus sp. CF4.18]|uniref:TnsA endonuclease N-terminal domain-containing protein n=1 Tax=Salipaludibacillus sp. CF4.18 TaxID=3373081 RepID=UPI003EE60C4B
MSRHNSITVSKIEKIKKQGRGQGFGEDYKPWLTIRNVKSRGFKNRINGWKTNRTHHLFSNLELSFLFWLESMPNVLDIRERYPLLPVEETIQIADELGVKHPFDRKKQEHIVMCTDFLVEHEFQNETFFKAYSVMTDNGLSGTSVLRKTMVERMFWQNQGIAFSVITESDIPKKLANNIDWLWRAKDIEYLPIRDLKELLVVEEVLSDILKDSLLPLAKACLLGDKKLEIKPGTSIQFVKHFIFHRYWEVDLKVILTTGQPLQFQRRTKL